MAETGQATALRWWALERGDIDATVAQVGFNVAQMIIPAFLLVPVGIAMGFSVSHLLPGFAMGFFAGSMGLTALAVALCLLHADLNPAHEVSVAHELRARGHEVVIAPLLDRLALTAGRRNWGYLFRFGVLAISEGDFKLIAAAMKIEGDVARAA